MLTVDYRLLGIKDGERVLDIGCGTGRHSWEACRRARCVSYALDIDAGELARARGVFRAMGSQGELRGEWILVQGSTTSLPFRSASFDKIICSEVLEHVADDQQSIREMARVLKPAGILAISVPNYLPETICWKISRDYHECAGGHIRVYKSEELLFPLRLNDLGVFAIRRAHGLHSMYWILRCLFGVNNDRAVVPSLYHRFLVWDMTANRKPVRWIEAFLNRFFPKSVVFYACKDRR